MADRVRLTTMIDADLLVRLEQRSGDANGMRAAYIEKAILAQLDRDEVEADRRARDRADTMWAG